MLIPWLGVFSLVGFFLVGSALPHWEWSPWLGQVSLIGNALSGWEWSLWFGEKGSRQTRSMLFNSNGFWMLLFNACCPAHSPQWPFWLHHLYFEVIFDALFFAPSTSLSSGSWILPPPWCLLFPVPIHPRHLSLPTPHLACCKA